MFALARLLHLASVVICLITIASFALFVVNQTSTASAHQQRLLNGELTPGAPAPQTTSTGSGTATGAAAAAGSSGSASSTHESGLRRAIDDASNKLTSPFQGAVSNTSSQWTIRIVKLLLALAVYGFGLGFLARVLRVRV